MKREFAGVAAGFTILTALFTYPQILSLGSGVGTHYDALFSIWRLAWLAHALIHQPARLFDANIFYPERGTLAYSDAMPLPALIAAPALWMGVNQVVVYNLLVLLSFVLCGMSMYLLVRHLTSSRAAAWFAGIVFAFQPYRFAHYAQIELLWSWPIPLALWALDRLIVSRRSRDGVLLGITLALQAWSCIYYFVFLLTAIAIVGGITLIRRRNAGLPGIVRPVLAAGAIVLVLVGPYAAAYASAAGSIGLRRIQDVVDWSPPLSSYLVAPGTNWLHGSRWGGASIEKMLFPGALALLMALVALVPPIDRRRAAYAVAALAAFELSLGVNGLTRAWAFEHLWVYRGLRVPARMSVVVSAMVAALGGDGVARLMSAARKGRHWVGAGVVAIALLESASMPLPLMEVDRHPARLYSWLRDQPRSVVMEWPLPKPSDLGTTRTPWYMYYSTYHWQPLVEGYSGFYPVSYIRFLEGVDRFPSKDAIEYLRRDDVKFVILHSDPDPVAYVAVRKRIGATDAFELITDERVQSGEIALYRLKP